MHKDNELFDVLYQIADTVQHNNKSTSICSSDEQKGDFIYIFKGPYANFARWTLSVTEIKKNLIPN